MGNSPAHSVEGVGLLNNVSYPFAVTNSRHSTLGGSEFCSPGTVKMPVQSCSNRLCGGTWSPGLQYLYFVIHMHTHGENGGAEFSSFFGLKERIC